MEQDVLQKYQKLAITKNEELSELKSQHYDLESRCVTERKQRLKAESCLKNFMSDCEVLKTVNKKLEKNLYVVREDFMELHQINQVLDDDNKKLRNQLQANEIGEQMMLNQENNMASQKSEEQSEGRMRLRDESGYLQSKNGSSALQNLASSYICCHRFSITDADNINLRIIKNGQSSRAGAGCEGAYNTGTPYGSSIIQKTNSHCSFNEHENSNSSVGVKSVNVEDIDDMQGVDGRKEEYGNDL